MKKVLIITVCALLALAFSACSNSSPTTTPQPRVTAPSSDNNTTTPPTGNNNAPDTTNSASDSTSAPEYDPEIYTEGFELWQTFYNLVKPMDGDSEFDMLFMIYRANEINFSNWYADVVHESTAEDFLDMSLFDRFLWYETYVSVLTHLNSPAFNGTERTYRQYVMTSMLNTLPRFNEEATVAYEELMMWQYDYVNTANTVFNFITGVNHRDSTGADFDPIARAAEMAAAEQALIEQELQEIKDELNQP